MVNNQNNKIPEEGARKGRKEERNGRRERGRKESCGQEERKLRQPRELFFAL